jgi:hypothetical protein
MVLERKFHFIILAFCSPACMHNSNCTGPNTCVCSAGYNGTYCEDRKFPSIQNFLFNSLMVLFFSYLSIGLFKWRQLRK